MNKDLFFKIYNNITLKVIIIHHLKNSCKCNIKKNFNKYIKQSKLLHYKWEQVIDSPRYLAAYGYLEQLKLYYERFPLPTSYFRGTNFLYFKPLETTKYYRLQHCLKAANNHHQLHIIKYYFEELRIRLDKYVSNLLMHAISINNAEVINYLLSLTNGIFDYPEAFATSPYSENMELVEMFSKLYFEKKGKEWSILNFALNNAAFVGRLDIMKWLLQTYNINGEIELNYNKCYQYSIQNGHLHILKYLVENNLPYIYDNIVETHIKLIDKAIGNNRLEILKYLNSHDDLRRSVSANPIDQGHLSDLEMMEWFFQNRTEPCTSKLHINAAIYGRLDILQWLHDNNIDGFTAETMDFAAIGKQLDVIKWLHENRTEGCTSTAMDYANDLEIVKYLHYNGKTCTNVAIDNSNLEVKKWLHENRTEGCTAYAMDRAASANDLESLKWLRENYSEVCTWDEFRNSTSIGSLEVIKWLYDNGYDSEYSDFKLNNWPDFFLSNLIERECNKKNLELFRWCIRTLPIKPLIEFQPKINDDTVSSTIYITETKQYLDQKKTNFCLIN